MVEDSERLGYPDRNECGWDSGHSGVTETSYISRLHAELVHQEHKDRGVVARNTICEIPPIPEDLIPPPGMTGNVAYATAQSGMALTGFVVDRPDLMGKDPRRGPHA